MTLNSKDITQGTEATATNLKEKWAETLSFYDQLISECNSLRPISILVKYIIEKGYNNYYFPGTSLFSLLISLPIDNKVNYSKTLKVEIDQLRNIVKFDYRDLTGLNRDSTTDLEKSLKWSDTCQYTECCDTLDHFISINEDWLAKTKK
ncbi:MAG: hypothetical protein V4613_08705 [Bacteroidota bacterium]